MQRTLQTCIHLFKTHPNKKNIRFVVIPIIREVLETSNDIAQDIEITVAKYKKGEPICEGIEFDFSMCMLIGQPKLWQVMTIANFAKQQDIVQSVKINERGESNHKEIILERLRAHLPARFENDSDLIDRAKVIKKFLREYINANPLKEETQEKYAVIAHSRIIATLTASGLKDDGTIKDFIWYKNCEVRPFHNY